MEKKGGDIDALRLAAERERERRGDRERMRADWREEESLGLW